MPQKHQNVKLSNTYLKYYEVSVWSVEIPINQSIEILKFVIP